MADSDGETTLTEKDDPRQTVAPTANPRKPDWVDVGFEAAIVVLCAVLFISRVFLGSGPWLSEEDASRTELNALVRNVWDLHPVVDVVLALLFLYFCFSSIRRKLRS
jgi:hypothetical protein